MVIKLLSALLLGLMLLSVICEAVDIYEPKVSEMMIPVDGPPGQSPLDNIPKSNDDSISNEEDIPEIMPDSSKRKPTFIPQSPAKESSMRNYLPIRRSRRSSESDNSIMTIRWQSKRPGESGGIQFSWPTVDSEGGIAIDWPAIFSNDKSGIFSMIFPRIRPVSRNTLNRARRSTHNEQQPISTVVTQLSTDETVDPSPIGTSTGARFGLHKKFSQPRHTGYKLKKERMGLWNSQT